MTLAELLAQLAGQGIELWVEGDNLRFRAPKGALTPALRDALVAHKPELIIHLREQSRQAVTYAPLSFGQQSMWVMQQIAPDSAAYHVSFSARIRSVIEVDVLRRTMQAITDRHPLLRTVYALRDGAPVQAVQGNVEAHLEIIDASAMMPETLHEALITAYERPFDLEHGPILRTHLFTIAPDNHILLLVVPHIAVDGWSLWLLLDDFNALYPSHLKGEPVSLPRAEALYADYVDWQSNLLTSTDGERLWNYWRDKLAGELSVLNLPSDHPRPPMPSYKGASHVFVLEESLTRRLREKAKAEGVTLYVMLLAAFQTLLYRYSGQDDIFVGSPMFGRSRPEFANIVGHFVNMVTLRGNFSGKPTFRQLLSQIRQTALEAIDHQDYPFSLLVQRLGDSRDVSHSPIFQVSFDLQRLQQNRAFSDLFIPGKTDVRVELGGLLVEPYLMAQQEGQFDLSIQMAEVGDALPGTIKYSTDLFEAASIQRMETHFVTLLESVLDNLDVSVADASLLPPAERAQVVFEWNDTRADYPETTLPALFESQAARTPDSVALMFNSQSVTYAELNRRANQLAHYLRGLGGEKLIGVSLERSIESVVALLGIFKSGSAYVPLDPHYPKERLAFMLEDTGLKLLVTQSNLVENLPEHGAKLVLLDSDAAAIAAQPDSNLVSDLKPDDMAYVLFTSGSTGRPKGVMAPHRGAINRFQWMWKAYPFQPGEVNSHKTTLNFVDSVWEIFGALLMGVPTLILSDDTVKDPSALVGTLAENGVTRIVLVPSLLRAILDSESDLAARLSHLKIWVTSGEAIPTDLVLRFRAALPDAALINLYGSSEVAADVTAYDTRDFDTSLASVPIGRPIANSQIYILDANRQPVPLGVPGEIHVGGVGLALGYLNRPELTAEKFIPDPFSNQPNARLYRTGDLGRYLPDGNIQYAGRVDHQVKLRGFRIELGEIESTLRSHAGVREALVLLREDSPGDQRLVAYWTAEGNNPPSINDLRDFLRETLMDYMIPSTFVLLEAMPLTPNGKVDRKALPAPDYVRPVREQGIVAPQTPTEILIADVWRELLKVDQISTLDNFFDLGGHSLMAIQVINKLVDKTGRKVEPAVMRFQSLGQLAAMYDAQ